MSLNNGRKHRMLNGCWSALTVIIYKFKVYVETVGFSCIRMATIGRITKLKPLTHLISYVPTVKIISKRRANVKEYLS
jgi:uncharacterized DUF497 family protein